METTGNTVIFGDSYSTFEGYIPEGYACYYAPHLRPETFVDVGTVEDTWWAKVIKDTGGKLLRNDSFSGSTVCHTGYDGADCSTTSFVTRAKKLVESGFFEENKVDTVFVFGLTNDFWAGSPTGGIKLANQTEEDMYKVFPALCRLLQMLKKAAVGAKIYCIINDELSADFVEATKIICDKTGAKSVELKGVDKINGHPTAKGMAQIAEQIEKNL